jgi:hypothetical protein
MCNPLNSEVNAQRDVQQTGTGVGSTLGSPYFDVASRQCLALRGSHCANGLIVQQKIVSTLLLCYGCRRFGQEVEWKDVMS